MKPPRVQVTVEIPKGSFIKRGSNGAIDFVSPFPCPFNYGSVPHYIGCDGDLLDAVVLGPRLNPGSRVSVYAYGAVGFSERRAYDDKLICHTMPLSARQAESVLLFFRIYALCKTILNRVRGLEGGCRCEGWGDAASAMARARRC